MQLILPSQSLCLLSPLITQVSYMYLAATLADSDISCGTCIWPTMCYSSG